MSHIVDSRTLVVGEAVVYSDGTWLIIICDVVVYKKLNALGRKRKTHT